MNLPEIYKGNSPMEQTTEEIIAEVNKTSAEIAARDYVDMSTLYKEFPMFFYKTRTGMIAVRRNRNNDIPWSKEVELERREHKVQMYVFAAIADEKGEDYRVQVKMSGGTLELSWSITQFLIKNHLISDMVDEGWTVQIR